MQNESYKIKLPQFEGPFDLLLFFIERDELDIYDIPITGIINDFLVYIRGAENLNIELFDIFGKSVLKIISNSINTEINTQNLPIGVYLVRLTSNEISEVLKFIKK